MSRWYLDSSAAAKLVDVEAESSALATAIDEQGPELVSCLLLETELRRAIQRRPSLTQEALVPVLERVALHDVPPSDFQVAGLLPGTNLRSLDALHLAAAIRLGVDAVVTYDTRMTQAARDLGLVVLAPA